MNKFRNKFIDLVFDMINPTEQEGFEPPLPFGKTVFKTVAINHSATAPFEPNIGKYSHAVHFQLGYFLNFS